jgi:peptidoglycan/xylan/chitin deacetylase (PgdA/CDA1 family)
MKRPLLLLCLLLAVASLRAQTLQVLCYHRFKTACGKDPYCTSFKDLDQQLRWLRDEGWQSVGLTQVAHALANTGTIPHKSVMLSVDDGYRAGAEGAAHFERYGFHGVFFINPGCLARGDKAAKTFLRASELKGLEARGHDIGSHSLTHPNLAKVPEGMDLAAYRVLLQKELVHARELLEKELGHPISDLAWPYGAYNNTLLRVAEAAGYHQCYTVNEAAAQFPGYDRMRVPRFLLAGHVPLKSFQKRFLRASDAPETLAGLRDGEIIYRSRLPLTLPQALEWGIGRGKVLPKDLPNSFLFLRTAEGQKGTVQRILVQIAPDAWEPFFRQLSLQPLP